LRMRAEDKVDAGAGPLEFVRFAVTPFVNALRASRRLPLRAHIEQVDEEVVRQSPRPLGEDAVLGLPEICAEDTQATEEHGHFRPGQRQQLCPIHQCLLRCHELLLAANVVAEAVAVETRWDTDRPDARILAFRASTSRSSISG